jgi:hypothetical protein
VVKPRRLNEEIDHLSRIMNEEEPSNLDEKLLDVQLFSVQIVDEYFSYIIEFLSTRFSPKEFNITQKKILVLRAANYYLIVGPLYKLGAIFFLRRCVMEHERPIILAEAHE